MCVEAKRRAGNTGRSAGEAREACGGSGASSPSKVCGTAAHTLLLFSLPCPAPSPNAPWQTGALYRGSVHSTRSTCCSEGRHRPAGGKGGWGGEEMRGQAGLPGGPQGPALGKAPRPCAAAAPPPLSPLLQACLPPQPPAQGSACGPGFNPSQSHVFVAPPPPPPPTPHPPTHPPPPPPTHHTPPPPPPPPPTHPPTHPPTTKHACTRPHLVQSVAIPRLCNQLGVPQHRV